MRYLPTFLVLLLLAACAAEEPPSQPAPFPNGEIIDLTHSFDEETIYWPTAEGFELDTTFQGYTDEEYYYEAFSFCAAEHGGTHLDAPIHFAEGQQRVDEIDLDRLMGPAVVVDVSDEALEERDYQIEVGDLEDWEAEHGPIADGSIVLLRTGYGGYWPDREEYMGTAELGEEAVAELSFPGLHPEAARWMVENRNVAAIGIDTASIDYGPSTQFESHQTLFQAGIPALENVANLDELPETDFNVIALPMKIGGGSGAPLRVVAVVP